MEFTTTPLMVWTIRGKHTQSVTTEPAYSLTVPSHYPWLPEAGQQSPQRRWWPDPITRADHPYLACNRGNPLATTLPKLHIPVRAGAKVTAWWKPPDCPPPTYALQPRKPSVPGYDDPEKPMRCAGPEYPWPHSHGPLMAYLADCEGPCDEWDGSGKRWFKIWEAGYVARGFPGSGYENSMLYPIATPVSWGLDHLINRGANVTIPETLKPGHYLLRYEIINLERRTEFYPQCLQLAVDGSGVDVPAEEYLVQFPGAYDMGEPGLAIGGKVRGPEGQTTFVSIHLIYCLYGKMISADSCRTIQCRAPASGTQNVIDELEGIV